MTETTTRPNGIDVDGLMATIGAVKANPALGSFMFKATSTWRGGTRNSGVIRGFTQAGQPDESRTEDFRLEGDEPPVLLGSNAGPNAVELLLQALGFCYSVGYAANAAAQGIEFRKTSPVRDCLVNPVPVETTLHIR